MTSATSPVRRMGLGLVGAGRFATFVATSLESLPQVEVRAVADGQAESARLLADRYDARAARGMEQLLADPGVDIVVIATPPADHAALTVAAISAEKHVFCEKPLALDGETAHHVVELTEHSGCTLVVDHVLRYNPIIAAVGRMQGVDLWSREARPPDGARPPDRARPPDGAWSGQARPSAGLLGPVQRFCFENDASDEDLGPEHWFWDEGRSGGIFVEHGVHFFDVAALLVGRPATAVQAQAARRPDGRVDLVSATVAHGADTLASHTHSFAHTHRCERQLMRLDHGTAEVRIEGWIPVDAVIDAWTDDAGLAFIEEAAARSEELLHVPGFRHGPDTSMSVRVRRDAGDTSRAYARGQVHELPHHVEARLSLGGPGAKAAVYAASVRACMADLVWSITTGARPVSDGSAAATAVMTAATARQAAVEGCTLRIPSTPAYSSPATA